jgi:hypothetical protein
MVFLVFLLLIFKIASPEADGPAVALYPEAEEAIKCLASSCHMFVFDVCSAMPRKHLGDMSEMSAWKEVAGANNFDLYRF